MWFSVALPLSFFMCVPVCVCVVFDEAVGSDELSTRGTFFHFVLWIFFHTESANAVFSFRALDFFLEFTTRCRFFSSCFCTCGFFHDEIGFCFGGSRRDAVLFLGVRLV